MVSSRIRERWDPSSRTRRQLIGSVLPSRRSCVQGFLIRNVAQLLRLPDLALAELPGARDHTATIGCDGHGVDFSGMALERPFCFSRRQVPNAQRVVVGAGDHVATIRVNDVPDESLRKKVFAKNSTSSTEKHS
jgi:hypothetical protein